MQLDGIFLVALAIVIFALMIFANQPQEGFCNGCEDPFTDKHIYEKFPYVEYNNLTHDTKFKTHQIPETLPCNQKDNYCNYPRLSQDQYPYIEYQPKRDWPRFEQLQY
ncbi:MAG: hypothetical protein CMF62_03825 [Magnetococcales bacterium]|nr:hypothetical protein [Magnetococcales bacterium]|tara:strand:- start:35743 stop:36066 length:324 start_codon:yes stop_codon:yes gene_type:complete